MSRHGPFLILAGRISPDDIPGLCSRARELLERCEHQLVVCDVGDIDQPDAVALDALARVQLAARRLGRRVRFSRACAELQELLALVGLDDILPCRPGSGFETRGQPEQRKQPGRIQEEGDPGDPAI